MDCPVCHTQGLAATDATCRQCNADFSGLRLLAQLEKQLSTQEEAQRATLFEEQRTAQRAVQTARRWGALAGLVGLLLAAGVLLRQRPVPPLTPVVVAAVVPPHRYDSVVSQLSELPHPAAAPTAAAAPLPVSAEELTTADGATYTYVVRRGDTLRRIAWRLYGRSSLAPRLQALNHIADPRRLQIGQRLRVFTI